MISETIPAALDGERLDRVVALIADVSRSVAAALVAAGGASVDGRTETSGKVRLVEGQSIAIDLSLMPQDSPCAPDPSVTVHEVHVDDHLVVVDKAAGVVVHPAPGHETGTLVNGLLALHPEIASVGEAHRPGIVHRLDAGTTGLLVVARSSLAHESLVRALAGHEVEREYLALVWGRLESAATVIDAPIGRDPRDPTRMAVVRDGKPARTRVSVVAEFDSPLPTSLVRCDLETGRTHQIRVHLAAIGHPVVGDATYGGARSAIRAPRPMLHARRLSFVHPATGETVEFESPVPEDMAAVIGLCSADDPE